MDQIRSNKWFVALLVTTLIAMGYAFFMHEPLMAVALITVFLSLVLTPVLVKNMATGLLAMVFLIPFSVDAILPSGTKVSAPAEVLTLFFLGVFVIKWLGGISINSKIIKHPISVLLLLDLVWSMVVTFTSEIPEVALKRVILKTLFFAVYYFMFNHFLTSNKDFKKVFWWYSLGLVIPILSTFYNHYNLGFEQKTSLLVSQPFYADHTIYAACLAFVVPFQVALVFLDKWNNRKWQAMGMLTLFVIAVVLSYSRAAWISLVAALGFYVLVKLKIKFWQFASLVVLLSMLFLANFNSLYQELERSKVKYGNDVTTHLSSVTNLQNDASNLERINRWVNAYRMFESKPITGYGPGTYQFIYDRFQTPDFMTRISTHNGDKGNAHSEYLTYLAETGLIGFLIFSTLVVYSIFLAMKLLRFELSLDERIIVLSAILGLITFYVHGLFNTFSDYEKMAVLYLGSLAFLSRVHIRYQLNN